MTPVAIALALSAALFAVGVVGLLIRRNLLIMLMSLELMLNGANLAFAAFARQRGDGWGQFGVLAGLAIAAAEAAVGLGIILACARRRGTVDVDQFNQLRG